MVIQPRRIVFPIFVANRRNSLELVRFTGTAFLVAPRLFVTCWHCVSEPLPEEHGYLGLLQGQADKGQPDYVEWLEDISQDKNGSDLATGTVRAEAATQFQMASYDAAQGADVTSFGYPLSGLKDHAGERMASVESRLFKGHIMRTFNFSNSSAPRCVDL